MAFLAALAVFVFVAALIFSFQLRTAERSTFTRERVARATGALPPLVYDPTAGVALRASRISSNPGLDRLLRGFQVAQSLDLKLSRSDWKLKVSDFMVITAVVGVLALVIATRLSGSILIGAVVCLIALFIPYFLLNRNIKKRRKLFNNQLIEVLTQMANSLKAGFGLLQAMSQAADEAKPPIATEFKQTIYDIQVGASVEDAFQDLNERVASPDLDIVITAILIQRGAGGSLAEILESVTHTMRERIRIRGEIDTLTSQQRLTGYLIGALPILLGAGFFLINRPYVSLLFTTNLGHIMLVIYAVMQGMGFFTIRRILNIEL